MTIQEVENMNYKEFLNVIKKLEKEEYKTLPRNERALLKFNFASKNVSSYAIGLFTGGVFASLTYLAMHNDGDKTILENIAAISISGIIVSSIITYLLVKSSKNNELSLASKIKKHYPLYQRKT